MRSMTCSLNKSNQFLVAEFIDWFCQNNVVYD